MKIIEPGHVYGLRWLDRLSNDGWDDERDRILRFVKREGENYPGNVGHHPGTTLQEVLRACIDRVEYLDGQIHDDLNNEVLRDLRHAILMLELRAARRHGRNLARSTSDYFNIEKLPVCLKCLHIGCQGECHP